MTTTTNEPAHWSTLRFVLTDAELDVLERTLVREEGVVLEEEAEEDGSPAAQEAARSLTLRGVLGEDGRISDGRLGTCLGVALGVRLAPRLVLRVVRVVSGRAEDDTALSAGQDRHAVHGVRLVHLLHGVACVEDALPGGTQLALMEPDQVVAEVVAVTVPEDAVERPGPAFVHTLEGLTRPTGDLARALRRPTSLVRLEADVPPHAALTAPHDHGGPVPVPGPSCHLVALGPRGCWAAELPPGRRATAAEFRPVGPGWVQEWARARTAPFVGQGTMAG